MTFSTQEHISAPLGASPGWLGGRWTASLLAHKTLYSLAFLTYGASLLQSYWLGVPVALSVTTFITTTMLLLVLIIILLQLAGELLRHWRQGAPGRPSAAIARKLVKDIVTPGRVSNGFHAIMATNIFAAGFTIIKSNIPVAVPFAWDATLMEIDQLLHFGVLPHDLLAPLYQSPLAIFIVNLIYNIWFIILLIFFVWQGMSENDSPLRQRYLISYLLCMGLGTLVLGTIFSSAGPCFYGLVVPGPNPYAGLMHHLAGANEVYPVWTIGAQHMLWNIYSDSNGTLSAISAMPSMHVASSVLFILCARASGICWLTWLCGFVAVAVFIGSIVLAWHYAVDGYAGAVLALACWKLGGWWVTRSPLNSRPS